MRKRLQARNTLEDIARECGVNVSTVSRSLNGAGRVNEKTRARILAAADRLNYRPNRIAQGLVTGRTHSIGLIVSDIRNPFFAEVARGVEDTAYAVGTDVVLCNSDLQPEKQFRYLQSLVEKGVDGVIMNYLSSMSQEQEAALVAYGVPIVLLNRPRNLALLSTVSINNVQGGFLAGSYLRKLGHRAVALLSGSAEQANHEERVQGFLKAIESAKGEITAHVFHGMQSFSGGYDLTWKLLASHSEVTAVFAGNDMMALGALRALNEAGRRVPADVSVIGFDNIELSQMIQPALTTIDQPKYKIGKSAVDLLLHLMKPPEESEPIHRVFGVHLVERQSTRRIE